MQKNKLFSIEEVGIMSKTYLSLGAYMAFALVANVLYHAAVSSLFTS